MSGGDGNLARDRFQVGLPIRPFLFTLDQIATLTEIPLDRIRAAYVHFDGRTNGVAKKSRLMARNIAEMGEKPDWRVTERELIRWMKHHGFIIYERGWAKS